MTDEVYAGQCGRCCKVGLYVCPFPPRNYMNDALRTNVFVRFEAETIACACIYLAARALQVCSYTLWLKYHVCVLGLLVSVL